MQAWMDMIHDAVLSVSRYLADCGRSALQCDRLRNAQSVIDTFVLVQLSIFYIVFFYLTYLLI